MSRRRRQRPFRMTFVCRLQFIDLFTGSSCAIHAKTSKVETDRTLGDLFISFQAAVMVLKNGDMVATVWAESLPYWATASNIAVLSLERGDQVWLLLLTRASYLHGYMYTTFSGFIIFEYWTNVVIVAVCTGHALHRMSHMLSYFSAFCLWSGIFRKQNERVDLRSCCCYCR